VTVYARDRVEGKGAALTGEFYLPTLPRETYSGNAYVGKI